MITEIVTNCCQHYYATLLTKIDKERKMNLRQTGKLDSYGQRINIYVTLATSNGKQTTYKTGRMTYPDGKILLATPFGEK